MTQNTQDQNAERPLARGEHIALRLWQNEEPHKKDTHTSPYETVGYVLSGRAEVIVNGESRVVGPGDSYHVPKGAPHTYRILETFSAVEATTPPAE
ncbi:cupin domain-containing protein [Deinococcus maricopensis]|uniref:Cupin 2 conserved barrel domain protein n=1 Tax=Deinococcus maricopensis (strain DSM 21211 / LMG 22137 / NRRL B-23946 / LB-34) TaxID=709986 RepID=E8U6G3_DEIML|nr:cupin domain-containing protein [Deinococcus maricopensis]ADV66652.1 Cupin 2 conserved barrel domain protein [Deinococcus maricopensis DSM 21211]